MSDEGGPGYATNEVSCKSRYTLISVSIAYPTTESEVAPILTFPNTYQVTTIPLKRQGTIEKVATREFCNPGQTAIKKY